jgi:hypothetical protein
MKAHECPQCGKTHLSIGGVNASAQSDSSWVSVADSPPQTMTGVDSATPFIHPRLGVHDIGYPMPAWPLIVVAVVMVLFVALIIIKSLA